MVGSVVYCVFVSSCFFGPSGFAPIVELQQLLGQFSIFLFRFEFFIVAGIVYDRGKELFGVCRRGFVGGCVQLLLHAGSVPGHLKSEVFGDPKQFRHDIR